MLVGVDDVAVVAVEEIGHSGDQPLLVSTGEEQHGGDVFGTHILLWLGYLMYNCLARKL